MAIWVEVLRRLDTPVLVDDRTVEEKPLVATPTLYVFEYQSL